MQSRPDGVHLYHSVKGGAPPPGDGIRHRMSKDNGKTWSASKLVLTPELQPGACHATPRFVLGPTESEVPLRSRPEGARAYVYACISCVFQCAVACGFVLVRGGWMSCVPLLYTAPCESRVLSPQDTNRQKASLGNFSLKCVGARHDIAFWEDFGSTFLQPLCFLDGTFTSTLAPAYLKGGGGGLLRRCLVLPQRDVKLVNSASLAIIGC